MLIDVNTKVYYKCWLCFIVTLMAVVSIRWRRYVYMVFLFNDLIKDGLFLNIIQNESISNCDLLPTATYFLRNLNTR